MTERIADLALRVADLRVERPDRAALGPLPALEAQVSDQEDPEAKGTPSSEKSDGRARESNPPAAPLSTTHRF